MKILEIKGLDAVLKNLAKSTTVGKIGQQVETGIKKAGTFLLRESQKIVPVDTGNLRASGYVRKISGSGFSTDVVVGYTAEYALFVHEDLSKMHGAEFNIAHADEIVKGGSDRGEQQQAKFLEQPAREKKDEILRIIAGKI